MLCRLELLTDSVMVFITDTGGVAARSREKKGPIRHHSCHYASQQQQKRSGLTNPCLEDIGTAQFSSVFELHQSVSPNATSNKSRHTTPKLRRTEETIQAAGPAIVPLHNIMGGLTFCWTKIV
ncbi:hypothetical protein IV203_022560 [Nitzschia inconspicua]|uniref:Uncharacterized protein n=1 Tax=Nitzschia inconspicua TaxID=303405 RepID=A0A9K3KIW9_9STRA|nr:hypothetical protein IV203_022560 [Nitzschia inconspicua]